MKKLLSETIIYGIGAILPRVITFLLNPLYIHYIDKEAFAIFTNLYAWIAYVNIILTFGFETSFFRFSTDDKNRQKVFNTSFWFIFGLAFSFLMMVLLFSNPLSILMKYSDYPEFLRWCAWIAFLDAVCVIPFAWLRFNNRPIKYSVIRVASIIVQSMVVIALFGFIPRETSAELGLKDDVSFPFISNLIASLVTLILLFPIIAKVRFQFSKELFPKMLKYSYPIMFAGLAFMINENFDKLIQYYYIPKGDAGAYGGCYKLAVIMTLFVTAYRMGVEPFFFKQMNNANAKETYAKITEFFTLFASVAAMGIIANISWLKSLFITDSSYWSAIDIVPVIVIANLCFGVYYNLSTWYKVTDRTQYGTLISAIGAGITIILHLVFLKKYGFMVSAWATLLSYFTMMILSYFLGQKYYPIPYNIRKISLVMVVLVAFSILSYQTFGANFWIGNFLLIIFTLFVLYLEKDFLLRKIKTKH
ncbi:MAG: oligosaccharide flippase family protein [Cruoricaptor ignavus]|nr:oligosaccharide flippase family protein [Cruoricaptor ignavus]